MLNFINKIQKLKNTKTKNMKNTLLILLSLISITCSAQQEEKGIYTFQLIHACQQDSLGTIIGIQTGDSIIYTLNLDRNYFEIKVITGYKDEKKFTLVNGKTVMSMEKRLVYTSSFGSIKKTREFKGAKVYAIGFTWDYKNSYDSDMGQAKVTLILTKSGKDNIGTFMTKGITGKYFNATAVCKEID